MPKFLPVAAAVLALSASASAIAGPEIKTNAAATLGEPAYVIVKNPDAVKEDDREVNFNDKCMVTRPGDLIITAIVGEKVLVEYRRRNADKPLVREWCPSGTLFWMARADFGARLAADEQSEKDFIAGLMKKK